MHGGRGRSTQGGYWPRIRKDTGEDATGLLRAELLVARQRLRGGLAEIVGADRQAKDAKLQLGKPKVLNIRSEVTPAMHPVADENDNQGNQRARRWRDIEGPRHSPGRVSESHTEGHHSPRRTN